MCSDGGKAAWLWACGTFAAHFREGCPFECSWQNLDSSTVKTSHISQSWAPGKPQHLEGQLWYQQVHRLLWCLFEVAGVHLNTKWKGLLEENLKHLNYVESYFKIYTSLSLYTPWCVSWNKLLTCISFLSTFWWQERCEFLAGLPETPVAGQHGNFEDMIVFGLKIAQQTHGHLSFAISRVSLIRLKHKSALSKTIQLFIFRRTAVQDFVGPSKCWVARLDDRYPFRKLAKASTTWWYFQEARHTQQLLKVFHWLLHFGMVQAFWLYLFVMGLYSVSLPSGEKQPSPLLIGSPNQVITERMVKDPGMVYKKVG